MNSPDLKKLITGFLILSVIISSAVLILSNIVGSPSQPSPVASQKDSSIGTNAFTAPTTGNSGVAALPNGGSNDPLAVNTTNMTVNLAHTIARQLIKTNPNGPAPKKGSLSLAVPDVKQLTTQYIEGAATIIPAVNTASIHISRSYNQNDILAYLENANRSLGQIAQNTNIKNFKDSDKTNLANAIGLLLSQTEVQLNQLSVPAPLLDIHKSILETLETQKAMLAASSDDPLKTMALIKNAPQILNQQKGDILKQLNALKKNIPKILSDGTGKNKIQNFAAAILGVQTANAIIVEDLGNLVENVISAIESVITEVIDYASYYLNYLGWDYNTILTETLKNEVLQLLVNAIINWVTGSGNPQFVTNWKSLLGNAFNGAAGAVIDQNAPGLCSSFGPLVSVGLRPAGGGQLQQTGVYSPTACTLDKVVSNLQGFYNNFESGGWAGYTTLLEPQNNLFGSIVQNSDIALRAGLEAQNAAQSQAQAGNGYNGTQSCDDQSSPDAGGQCADGSTPTVTTPGSQQSDLTSRALGSPIDRIVNAQDWESLAVGVITLVVGKLTSSGNKGLLQGNLTGTANASIICAGYPTSSPAYATCIANANKANNPPGSENAGGRAVLLTQANQILDAASSSLKSVNVSLDAVGSTISILNVIVAASSTCPTQAAQAQSALDSKTSEFTSLTARASTLTQKITDLGTFISTITSHTPTNDEPFYTEQTGVLNNQFGTAVQAATDKASDSTQAQTDTSDLSKASDLLRSCTGG
jgi:hypothetical protein